MDKRINNHWAVIHWFGWKKLNPEKHKFYDLYCWMRARCYRKEHSSYKNYWWRWIKVLWNSFEEFKNDMYESYLDHIEKYWKAQTSLDRIDNDWNYCKENCRRATRIEQRANQRKSLYVVVDWIKYTTRDISEMCHLCIDWASDRIKKYKLWFITKEQLLKMNRLIKEELNKSSRK